jgi:hypothetical protein
MKSKIGTITGPSTKYFEICLYFMTEVFHDSSNNLMLAKQFVNCFAMRFFKSSLSDNRRSICSFVGRAPHRRRPRLSEKHADKVPGQYTQPDALSTPVNEY